MKILSLLSTICFLFLLGACEEGSVGKTGENSKSTSVTVDIPAGWKTTNSSKFTISYPSDWTADTSGQMGTKLFLFAPQEGPDDNFSENINLMFEELPSSSIGLDAYVEASEKQIEQYIEDAEILTSQRIDVNGKEFQDVSYTGTQNKMALRFQQYYTIHKGKAYILTLTCKKDNFDSYGELGVQIMKTFVFN